MYKLKVYSDCVQPDCYFDEPLSFYVHKNIDTLDTNKKIVQVIEPPEVRPEYYQYVKDNYDKFDFVLTYDTELLKLPNAILYEHGNPWVNNYVDNGKKFGISTVVGNKRFSEGHSLRTELWKRQDEIDNRFFFKSCFGSPTGFETNVPLHERSWLFEYQYSIVIENTKLDYYFTEKILDCLLCKAIPIYYGARKIYEYFDNIIQVDSVDDIVAVCNKLTPYDYENSTNIIESNCTKAKRFLNPTENLKNKINELYGKI